MYTLPGTLSEDIQYFGSLIDEFHTGRIEPVKFKAIRVLMGIYEQRSDGTYMVRIRCAGGYISPHQLRKVSEIAAHHHSNLLHLTTRQELQIQNLKIDDTLVILQNLKEIGLASKGGGGNTVRNIMASVDSGIAKDEVFDVLPYAVNLTSRLITEPDSFTLPRKFKITFSNTENDTGYAAFNDLGFVARIKDGRRGFKVYIGGSLGLKPMVGYELFDFAAEEDILYIADAAKKLFSRYGNRKNKHKARLRYVFYKLGKDEVFRLFHEIYREVKKIPELAYKHAVNLIPHHESTIQQETVHSEEFEKWKSRYVSRQRQPGMNSVIIPFENGNANPGVLHKIADFAFLFGEDTIRFSMRQNLHLRNIPGQFLGNVYNFLIDLGMDTRKPLLLNTIVSCTGADTCRLGICLSKGANGALKKALIKSNLELDKVGDLKINISGCPNSCGQQIASDIGFYGKVSRNDRLYPAYNIVVGASSGKEPKLAERAGEISARDLPQFTVDLIDLYLKKSSHYQSFTQYVLSEGKEDISTLTAKYNASIPDFADDKNYYFDWDADSIFSLVNKGMAECSAGLFDMIDVDLNTIETNSKLLESEVDSTRINEILGHIIFASARMLLITRGAEPKNTWDVYDLFLSKFIDAKLISSAFREIIETVRDNDTYDFSDHRLTILDLARSVVSLYESMDDSLQFKLAEQDTEPDRPSKAPQKQLKDFRNVACPMNFVKTKIALAALKPEDILEIWIDDGEPIENVPGSIKSEGHKILDQKKIDNYWSVTIQKA